MHFKELIYSNSEYKELENDISDWVDIFIFSIEKLVNGFEYQSKKRCLKKDIYFNKDLYAEVLEQFEESVAKMSYEYKIISKENYSGIRECKIFASFLYNFLRLMPFHAGKHTHINIFIYMINIIRDGKESLLKIEDYDVTLFRKKISYLLEEKQPTIDCIYTVCRTTVFNSENKN